jgi:hypothetical protein
MNKRMNQSGSIAMVAGVVIALAIIAVIGVKVVNSHKTVSVTNTASSTNTAKASDLRANLVTMAVEHMILTDDAVDATLDGSKDASAVDAALYANGNDIGAAVGSIYGSSAQTTFDSVWKLHLDQFVAYAGADASGDTAGKTAALNAISTGYTKPLAEYLAKANPNLPEATLESSLNDHVAMTATMIDDHVQGNYTAEQTELNMANTHIEGLFSTLSAAIVKQYPSKFQD